MDEVDLGAFGSGKPVDFTIDFCQDYGKTKQLATGNMVRLMASFQVSVNLGQLHLAIPKQL